MIPQSKGKMFLAAERGHTETDWFRSYNTFRFGQYQHPDKAPFGPLYVLNNDTLAGGKSFSLQVEETSEIIVLPTVGAILYRDSTGNENVVEAGQAQRFTTPTGTTITFENPYAEDPVNFLQLWLKKEDAPIHSIQTVAFDIEAARNQLVEIFPAGNARFFISKMDGRAEIDYHLPTGTGLFVYVLEGAFEVAYRLLETGDALALWDASEIEIEALSNDAIILFIELDSHCTASATL